MSSNSDSQNDSGAPLPHSPVSSYPTDRSSPSSSSSSPEPIFKPSLPEHSANKPFFPSATFEYYQRHYQPRNPSSSSPFLGFRQRITPSVPCPSFVPAAWSGFAPAAASTSCPSQPTPQPPLRRPPVIKIDSDSDEDDFVELFNPTPLATEYSPPPEPTSSPASSLEESSSDRSITDSDSDCSSSSSSVAPYFKSCIPKPFRNISADNMRTHKDQDSQCKDSVRGVRLSEVER